MEYGSVTRHSIVERQLSKNILTNKEYFILSLVGSVMHKNKEYLS